MRTNTAGFTTPENRQSPQPFYYNMPPPIFRWRELNWRYDATQRWFYNNFTGRTADSIWLTECSQQVDGAANAISQVGDYSDALNWSLPVYVNSVATIGLGHPVAFSNYVQLGSNVRAANPKTGRAASVVVDELYIATRHSFPRAAFRIDMRLPSAAQIAARTAAAGATDIGVGFEVNSQGGSFIYRLQLYDAGAGPVYRLQIIGYGADGTLHQIDSAAITINQPNAWATYYFEWDPPVFRFVQPTAGQTNCFAYPAVTELSIPDMAAVPHVQPIIYNESATRTDVLAPEPLTWDINTWAIYPLHVGGNTYKMTTRTNAGSACGSQSARFDTGGRPYVHINIESGCGCTYYIYHTEDGANQPAGYPEVRTWRRIDDADWTGVTDTPYGMAGIGLFNAARFLCVVNAGCNACNVQTIVFTANSGGQH